MAYTLWELAPPLLNPGSATDQYIDMIATLVLIHCDQKNRQLDVITFVGDQCELTFTESIAVEPRELGFRSRM